jgi:hypothetical protein
LTFVARAGVAQAGRLNHARSVTPDAGVATLGLDFAHDGGLFAVPSPA